MSRRGQRRPKWWRRLPGPRVRWRASHAVPRDPTSFPPPCSTRLGAETAEPAFAGDILVDRGLESRMIEIRPEVRQEDEFRIGALPGQEIGEALFARGTDDEVRVRNADRIERALDGLRIDALRI